MADLSDCCQRPYSRVTVSTSGAGLTLATCTSCGSHHWEGDGTVLERADMLERVRLSGAELKGRRVRS